ncbi:MAG: serine/threonine protein kinase, partial [Planctomycetes bacterium]|nr:serine/threonine protein kinase [Planctomycetota bacterium]
MAAIAPTSSADLLDLIRKSHILPAERLAALPALADLPAEPTRAATALVRDGFVTKFQATQLLAGRHKGFRVGPYVIQDLLGRGGMGAVYLGVHLELQRKVAIKVLAPGKGEDQRLALERFLREARAAAALDHPNIVRIFDVARHNESPYLVMEYVDGETLQQTLDRDGRVPHDVAAEYVAQAAAGLQHAHEKGFVHRDIKPGNLIRDRFGTVKLLDMGLARSASDKDKLTEKLDEGAVVGTADFIAPEQAINSPDVDGRADIYSLGATLFTLVCGKTPFDGNTTQKLMQHQMKAAPPLTGVPAELAALVARMLEKKPGARFQTAAEVIAALAPWTAGSARVLAGLSRTAIGQSDSRASLGDWSLNGSSSRLRTDGGATSSIDTAALDPTQAGIATAALSASETARSRTPARRPVRSFPDERLWKRKSAVRPQSTPAKGGPQRFSHPDEVPTTVER